MPHGDGATPAKKSVIFIELQKLFPVAEKRAIDDMASTVMEKVSGMGASQMKEALKEILTGVSESSIGAIVESIIPPVISYPPRTRKAREECKHVVDIMNSMIGTKRRKAVSVITHEDGTVSVGFSGQGNAGDIAFAQQLENKLNGNKVPKKYTVSAVSMPTDTIKRIEDGNEIGECAEPKVMQAAHENPSKIDGMDTRWRIDDGSNPYPFKGENTDNDPVDPTQMEPCPTCNYPDNIKEYMTYANANKI